MKQGGDLRGLWEPRSPWSGLEESSMRLEEHCECKDLVVIKCLRVLRGLLGKMWWEGSEKHPEKVTV